MAIKFSIMLIGLYLMYTGITNKSLGDIFGGTNTPNVTGSGGSAVPGAGGAGGGGGGFGARSFTPNGSQPAGDSGVGTVV